MITAIIELIFTLIGLAGIVVGIKTTNSILMGEGIFLLIGINFFEIILIKNQLRKITNRGNVK